MNQLIASVASEVIAMHGDNDYKSNWLCINYYAVFSIGVYNGAIRLYDTFKSKNWVT